MNINGRFDEISFRLLDELTKDCTVTQRTLASRLGIALGLVNAYVKRLYKKGYIKIKTLPKNRIRYIITPKGLSEKAKLTYNYMHYSINYFKDVRHRIEQTYAAMIESNKRNILLWGDGEIAELCYISTRGLPLKIVGVVADKRVENGFFGHHIYTVEDIAKLDYDAVLVSSMEHNVIKTINTAGIDASMIYYL